MCYIDGIRSGTKWKQDRQNRSSNSGPRKKVSWRNIWISAGKPGGHVHDSYILHDPADFEKWRETIFRQYRDAAEGIGLPPGFVPSVTWWIRSGGRIAAVANLRPKLSERLRDYGGHLGIALRPSDRGKGWSKPLVLLMTGKAREFGIGELLLTCEADNPASVRLCESLPYARHETDETTVGGRFCRIHRIWIDLTGK